MHLFHSETVVKTKCKKIFVLPAVCSRTVNTGNVSGSVCHLTSECTFSECCTEVSFLQRSFHTFLHIDPCNFVMVVGIETYSRNISLAGYHWGLYSQSVGIQNIQSEHSSIYLPIYKGHQWSAACRSNINVKIHILMPYTF